MGLWYVCVKGGAGVATYSLLAKELNQTDTPTVLKDGYAEYFFIGENTVNRHVYSLSRLDYSEEDLSLDFSLTVRRGSADLLLTVRLANGTEEVKGQRVSGGKVVKAVVDHDESKCRERCEYEVTVRNPGRQKALYKLVASHSQNNHIVLQESVPHTDTVELRQYKYFKFSVFEKIVKVLLFEMTPLHGDADLFVSRSEKFPSKQNYEGKSQRMGNVRDRVEVENATEGTYYVGVYGYSAATFTLVASAAQGGVGMAEGYPVTKTLHNELEVHKSFFVFDMAEDEEVVVEVNTY